MRAIQHGKAFCISEVIHSGLLKNISAQELKLQEAMFEIITSEASYLRSLDILVEHFMMCPELMNSANCVLDRMEREYLFSDILPVRNVSQGLLTDLEKRWKENLYISDICDILYEYASCHFSVYVKYCTNQIYQERTFKQLKKSKPEFVQLLRRLEADPVCQNLDMHSFLILPVQRITRLPLLVDAIFHRLPEDSLKYESCKQTLAVLNKVVSECNESARKMERIEEVLHLSRQLDFKLCKGIPLISSSRWLVKKGEVTRLLFEDSPKYTFGRATRCNRTPVYLFLFSDLLIVTKRRSEESYTVLDYCPRNMVQVMFLEQSFNTQLPFNQESYKNVFQLIMLNNHEGKTMEMILSCSLNSERTRWMEAVTPSTSENLNEKIYEEWDCPQVQCIENYQAQQPDELSLEEADVVNVFRKMADGWYEGERIRDGTRGWFPSKYVVEVISSHIRARNLRQRYRLLVLTHSLVEEQLKSQQKKKSNR
ncbi:ephexin-1-like isoform X1 [Limulus polyphemus]|uniref:Ephexin-1-like isoform X1 n=1 Tax=Limulus polyphemus TaxID=6850 RepID=A0ABM1SP55_LIMPO|nr:ephexin-1-like isoform X1 [Limulus polyphemus]